MRTLLLMAVVCTLLASGTARPTPRLLLQGSADGVTNGTIANATIANGTNAGNAPATNGTILDTNTTTGASPLKAAGSQRGGHLRSPPPSLCSFGQPYPCVASCCQADAPARARALAALPPPRSRRRR